LKINQQSSSYRRRFAASNSGIVLSEQLSTILCIEFIPALWRCLDTYNFDRGIQLTTLTFEIDVNAYLLGTESDDESREHGGLGGSANRTSLHQRAVDGSRSVGESSMQLQARGSDRRNAPLRADDGIVIIH
jgi:hypothetical protein